MAALPAKPLPRGVANNNPGNIRKGDPWQGLTPGQPDPDFCTFKAPEFGIRAIARLLIRYHDYNQLRTIRGLVTRWAPPDDDTTSDHNPTNAYVNAIALWTGKSPDQEVDVTAYVDLEPIVRAMIRFECAGYRYPQSVIDAGLNMAGVRPPSRALLKSKQVIGTVTASAGGTAIAVNELAQALSPVSDTWKWVKVAIACLVVGGALLALVGKVRQHRETGV